MPKGADPRDTTAPAGVTGLRAEIAGSQVKLTWDPVKARDVHHYSVYCGKTRDFACDNRTLIRSVFKTSVTDAPPQAPTGLHYKVLAVDSRWNRGAPAIARAGSE